MKWPIRLAAPDDAATLAQLFYDTVRSVNTRDYTDEQVRAWAPTPRSAEAMRLRQHGKQVWVAEDGAMPIGFIELDPDGHIDCLYCHKDYQRMGVATQLYAALENHARRCGLTRLYVEASITARPFFESRGFQTVRAQQVERLGVQLANFVMERDLLLDDAKS
jgi:N-acetylglutamate synthase-like GNAT family acetyltransferase